METVKTVLIAFGIFVLIMAIGFVGNVYSWWTFSFFAPKIEQVRYDTHKHSQAYQDGMAQQLSDAAEQWPSMTETQKGSVRAVLRSRMRDFDTSNLSPDLLNFYEQYIKGNN